MGPGPWTSVDAYLDVDPPFLPQHSSLTTTSPLLVSPHKLLRRPRSPRSTTASSPNWPMAVSWALRALCGGVCAPGGNQTIKPVPSETSLSPSSGVLILPVMERDIDTTIDATRRPKQGPKATTWTHLYPPQHFLPHSKDSARNTTNPSY